MKKSVKKTASKTRAQEFRPYRVLFLVVVVGVTSLVFLAMLGVTSSR